MKLNRDPLFFTPPYCPESRCSFHFGTNEKFYVKNGFIPTNKPPFKNQRYRCKECSTQFSRNTFDLDFRKRLPGLSSMVLHFSMNGMSNNSIAKHLHVREKSVRKRLHHLALQALYFEKSHHPKTLTEDVAYDGFETFTHSQFSPCYVNTAVGKRSHFIYHNTLSPLNRKGRMTREQKVKNQKLQSIHGFYPRDSVYAQTIYILNSLSALSPRERTVFTDEHKAYARAFKALRPPLHHHTTNSKKKRDAKNPLFAVNHLHLMYRHFFSSQKRETISFQKHEAALLEKMQLMKIYRNYMNPKFVKKNTFDERAHRDSPAMYLGVTRKILNFEDVFQSRKLPTQFQLDLEEENFVKRHYPYSRVKIAA